MAYAGGTLSGVGISRAVAERARSRAVARSAPRWPSTTRVLSPSSRASSSEARAGTSSGANRPCSTPFASSASRSRCQPSSISSWAALSGYIDDVVEPRTAALLEPYTGCGTHRGETFYPAEEFAELLAGLDARGFQCFVHATGDRGIRTVLDAVEHARTVNGPREARHQVVHVECLDPADVPRFAELGVVACMQPRHCAPEIAGPGQDWAENVGEDRWHKAWPMRSLHEAGAVLAFSSDWNVAEMDPMVGIYTAVTRRPLDGGDPWQPAETVDVRTGVYGYTMGSAHANFLEAERGSLTVGKAADFVVLSRDILAIAAERIPGTVAETVVVAGEVVHRTA